MPGISETLDQLRAAPLAALPGLLPPPASARLRPFTAFGSNPGALNGWCYVPEPAGAMALVVVLHGCTQTASGYDHGSGWSDLAERYGFAVLCPEQRRENNPNLCFNWFQPEDASRGRGEALSIRQMIAAMADRHPIDPARIYVTGLSAGGAMTSVMLATYPDVFAGGAIIAGLPHGAAASVPEAFERMRGAGHPTPAAYADAVRGAAPDAGRWPSITIWHGDADRTVAESNAAAIEGQWRLLHGVAGVAGRVERIDGHERRRWRRADGSVAVERYRIAGLGHGTPLKTGGDDGCGVAGPYMLEAGISSTWRQAESWGLLSDRPRVRRLRPVAEPAPARRPIPGTGGGDLAARVGTTIEQALRSAGVMR